ncbi:MAG: hypothetical protein ACXVJT_00195 [Thermoanaerobaculia bacterium]
MRARILMPLAAGILLCLAACTHSVTGEEDSTNELSFSIVQTANPPIVGSITSIDVPFEITIGNKTAAPMTVNRISLQSMEVGDYQIPYKPRNFDRVIAPGAKEKFEFWANAIVTDPILGTRAPLTLRTMVDLTVSGGTRHEVFVRGINGRLGFGTSVPTH